MQDKTSTISATVTGRMASLRRRYLTWRVGHLSPGLELVIIASLIGVFTGMAAVVIKSLIRLITDLVMRDLHIGHYNLKLLIWPVTGVLLVSIYQRYVVRRNIARGTAVIKSDLAGKTKLGPFMIFNPIVGCAATIGFGASGGSESPTALSGAAIGSTVGKWFDVSGDMLRLMVAIGGGAGISAIFKSPFGGVLFALEVLRVEMTTRTVMALIIACLLASTTAYFLSNYTFDIFFNQAVQLDSGRFLWFALLGLFCGLYSLYYSASKNWAARRFESIRNPWIAALITGAILSFGAYMFPTLYGEGMGSITSMINGHEISFTASGILAATTSKVWVYVALIAILLIKSILVSAANSGGGVAGEYVPTFFAGACAGYLFAMALNDIFGLDLPVWFFALAGMGAVMAGTVHAPLMAIFILVESTNTFAYLVPYIVTIVICYIVVRLFTPGLKADPVANAVSGASATADEVRSADNTPQGQK